jgi:hypothetical protein
MTRKEVSVVDSGAGIFRIAPRIFDPLSPKAGMGWVRFAHDHRSARRPDPRRDPAGGAASFSCHSRRCRA